MWNVLLVEDEVFVRRRIREMIRWEELGFVIAAEAGSGEEALAVLREKPIDLVIADIVMPGGMDGVELLRRARQEGQSCLFVMLTAMSEFEYARLALEYGASAYLLKLSMNVQALEETLAKADRELRRLVQHESRLAEEPFRRLYGRAWRQLCGEGHGADSGAWAQAVPPFGDRCRNVWIGAFLNGGEPLAPETLLRSGLVGFGCRSLVHAFAHAGQTTVFVWNPQPGGVPPAAGTLPPGAVSPIVPAVRWQEAWAQVLRGLDRLWYGGEAAFRTGARASGEAAAGAAPERPADGQTPGPSGPAAEPPGAGSSPAGAPGAAPEPSGRAAQPLAWKTERTWLEAFERRSLSAFCERVAADWPRMVAGGYPMAAVKAAVARIDRQLALTAGAPAEPEEELAHAESCEALRERFLLRAERYAEEWRRQPVAETDHPDINRVLEHIRTCYEEDITLKAVAAMVAMDETYLSALFKKKTGDTLIHFVQKLRVEQAKRYLDTTGMPVADIGARVGFPNANYFIKIFKRWTGQTPSEYRARTN
ncbi:hypothetical protein J31TS4_18060 [Paenibacillus sp. J31TS4]|uniref:response regulator transcription factor n=1 Tax=Paenibacillus sp. J31TS4 TaxID=2807195 RepID=UPI001B1D7E9C|nr:helix-turn-helix domain-containing protein [Paenibacillus sp. J31TS4]GIP38526.1 hypothetical protein J31TS4_18060 [Paenibacillus sp. J31TS4]